MKLPATLGEPHARSASAMRLRLAGIRFRPVGDRTGARPKNEERRRTTGAAEADGRAAAAAADGAATGQSAVSVRAAAIPALGHARGLAVLWRGRRRPFPPARDSVTVRRLLCRRRRALSLDHVAAHA